MPRPPEPSVGRQDSARLWAWEVLAQRAREPTQQPPALSVFDIDAAPGP